MSREVFVSLYALGGVLSFPLLTILEYRHARWKGSCLSPREDLGFAIGSSLIASVIWPLGWILCACSTGFFEGALSNQPKSATGGPRA